MREQSATNHDGDSDLSLRPQVEQLPIEGPLVANLMHRACQAAQVDAARNILHDHLLQPSPLLATQSASAEKCKAEVQHRSPPILVVGLDPSILGGIDLDEARLAASEKPLRYISVQQFSYVRMLNESPPPAGAKPPARGPPWWRQRLC